MKIATGTVVDGQIVLEGQPFADGEKVTVLSHEEEEFELSAEQKQFLLESIAAADRGDLVDAELDESN